MSLGDWYKYGYGGMERGDYEALMHRDALRHNGADVSDGSEDGGNDGARHFIRKRSRSEEASPSGRSSSADGETGPLHRSLPVQVAWDSGVAPLFGHTAVALVASAPNGVAAASQPPIVEGILLFGGVDQSTTLVSAESYLMVLSQDGNTTFPTTPPPFRRVPLLTGRTPRARYGHSMAAFTLPSSCPSIGGAVSSGALMLGGNAVEKFLSLYNPSRALVGDAWMVQLVSSIAADAEAAINDSAAGMQGRAVVGDAVTLRWSPLDIVDAPPPLVHSSLTFSAQLGEFFCFGGLNEAGLSTAGLHRMTLLPDDKLLHGRPVACTGYPPDARHGHSAFLDDNDRGARLYVFGGVGNGAYRPALHDLYELSLQTLCWREVALPYSFTVPCRTFHSAVSLPTEGSVLLIGGSVNGAPLRQVWEYFVESEEWQVIEFPLLDTMKLHLPLRDRTFSGSRGSSVGSSAATTPATVVRPRQSEGALLRPPMPVTEGPTPAGVVVRATALGSDGPSGVVRSPLLPWSVRKGEGHGPSSCGFLLDFHRAVHGSMCQAVATGSGAVCVTGGFVDYSQHPLLGDPPSSLAVTVIHAVPSLRQSAALWLLQHAAISVE